MRILIDTNILIHLEDNKVVDSAFYEFYQLAISNSCSVLYHRDCIIDLSNDVNTERRKIILSKIKKYSALENPAELDSSFSNEIGEKNKNDKIDNAQLFQIYKGYVELFITEDIEIHKKAKKLDLSEKVLNIKDAKALLDKLFTLEIPSHPVLEHVSIRNLENEFDSPFFDSLKNDYNPELFMKWLYKCAKEDRKCYALKIDNNLSAILIYKAETSKDHKLENINENVLKISTLKVADSAFGLKLGELFFNLMFQLCIKENIKYLYVTTYKGQNNLINLLEKYGFELHSEFINNASKLEFRYLKSLKKEDNKNKKGLQRHPFFDISQNKYIVPIQTQFYNTLFKDGNLREPTLFDKTEYGLQEIQGNTIEKAYISNTQLMKIEKSDLLFFYSSSKYKTIEPVGIVLEHKTVNHIDELWGLVKRRTVYKRSTLEKMLKEKGKLTVTIFRLVLYLQPVIRFEEIKKFKSFSNKFQTYTKLQEEDFERFIKKSLDESYIID